MTKQTEKTWVRNLRPKLETKLPNLVQNGTALKVEDHTKLRYILDIDEYSDKGPNISLSKARTSYEVDLLISDSTTDGHKIPRVVIECKIGGFSAHEAQAYSAKAASHKSIHPYLRYGILVCKTNGVRAKYLRHGANFDFIVTLESDEPMKCEWSTLTGILSEEIIASRRLQELFANYGGRSNAYRSIHHQLVVVTR